MERSERETSKSAGPRRPPATEPTALVEGGAGRLGILGDRGRVRSRFNTARRAFAVLNLISLREGITAKALGKELGVSLSTCYCLINILVEEGYVEKIPRQKGYRLGPAVALLHARAHNTDVDARVEPIVGELAARSNRHAYLGLLSDGDVAVARVESPKRRPPVDLIKGCPGASHALAVGKILIANMRPAGVEDYAEHLGLEAFTPRTITDLAGLKAHLAEVRDRGFATDLEEFSENVCCVAAPVTSEDGKIEGAIGISTTARHFYEESGALIELVRRYAREASALLE